MKQINFFYIQPQIVGTPEKWGYAFNTNGWRFSTKERAIKFGENELGHDDFWVAKDNGKKIIALYNSSGERRNKKSEKIEIKEITEEYGGGLPDNPNKQIKP